MLSRSPASVSRALVLACALAAWPAGRLAPPPVLAAPPGQANPPPAPIDVRKGNRLVNPGFEGAFVLHGASELVVGEGWTPWYDGSLVRPEFKDEPYVRYKPDGGVYSFSLRVFHGAALQKFFTSSAAHDAGLAQRVTVPAGARVRFSAYVMAWTSDCDDPCRSPLTACPGSNNSNGEYRVQVGVDPTGAPPPVLGQPPPGTVVWSSDVRTEAWDRWVRLGLTAEARGDAVTVYLRGRAKWAVKHNDSYWDEARLEVIEPTPTAGASSPAETPSPSATPAATASTAPPSTTATSAPTMPPTATASPVPPTVTPAPSPAARIVLPLVMAEWRLPIVATWIAAAAASRDRADGAPGMCAAAASDVAPADAVPPDANIVITYPIRAHPGMVNFHQPTCDELAFESVLIQNVGTVGVRMAGWTLANRAGDIYTFPPVRLDAGELVRVWTGPGPAEGYDGTAGGANDVTDGHFVDLYWRRGAPLWDDASDRATLRDDLGTVVAERGYP